MKEYYLFPTEGAKIKVEKEGDQFKLNIEDYSNPEWSFKKDTIVIKYNYFTPTFTKETLINQLEEFIKYVKKYG